MKYQDDNEYLEYNFEMVYFQMIYKDHLYIS